MDKAKNIDMEYILLIFIIAGIYIILTLSLNLIVGFTGLTALGHTAFSCIGVGTKFMCEKGYSIKKPYCFSVIKLDEGPMISGQLVGVDETKPETIKIDSPVQVKFLETEIEGKETRLDLGFEPL